jgi:hypothetical protein
LCEYSFVEHLARESGKEAIYNDREIKHQVFVEHVANQITVPSLSFSAVVKHESSEIFEFS